MNAAEIVVRKVQRQGRLEIRQLLREGVRQPGEPAAHHPDSEVLPLDVTGADMGRRGIPVNHRGYDLR